MRWQLTAETGPWFSEPLQHGAGPNEDVRVGSPVRWETGSVGGALAGEGDCSIHQSLESGERPKRYGVVREASDRIVRRGASSAVQLGGCCDRGRKWWLSLEKRARDREHRPDAGGEQPRVEQETWGSVHTPRTRTVWRGPSTRDGRWIVAHQVSAAGKVWRGGVCARFGMFGAGEEMRRGRAVRNSDRNGGECKRKWRRADSRRGQWAESVSE
ncbi:hypothetical protein PYCCODRAFT_446566 [Trametes coccinea BRFM310]|uniref:Uncharacterized protein n=1 Tax=Trametes coccinea (strain BRFM310) TaxID=1353009 RepID=A0A1Y2IND7_TRAC3|nr:hypothetical protein PYCCODRAFT_446566 [Trametes coccinea BRFM310]